MKYYGDINLNQNQLQNAIIPIDPYFPANPKVGQLAFVQKILYICVDNVNDLPIWIPLTNEINTFIHSQSTASAQWQVNHNLNSGTVQVQVFGNDNKMVIPNEITITDKDNVTIDFGIPFAGRAVVMIGSTEGNSRPDYGFEYLQTSLASTWTINHYLGYNPIIRVFVGNEEVQPSQIIHDSVNVSRVIFTSPYVGIAKCI